MQRKSIVVGLIALVLLAGLGYSAWRYVTERSGQSCKACARPVHAHMKTVAILDGERSTYCCPACALSEHQQLGKPVQVVELTDYITNTALKPETSFLVRNSDVNPCLQHHHPDVSENSQPLESHFDRCSPSVLAFRDQTAAAGFAAEHGGQVIRFSEFEAAYQR